jgi:hypothetical protein
LGIRSGLSPTEIEGLTPTQIREISHERESGLLQAAYYNALAANDPKALQKAIREHFDPRERDDYVEEVDPMTFFKDLGKTIIDETKRPQ